MSRIQIAPDGPTLSRIIAGVMSWGEWGKNFTVEQTAKYINQCVEMGITTFDHADIYGHYTTEALFGQAIKGKSALRDQIELISKCGIKLTTPNRPDYHIKSYDTSKTHIIASVERSLKNLETDYLDVLLIHRPSPLMDPEEIAEAFSQLRTSGKVRHFGVSNFTLSQLSMLANYFPLVTNQIEISLLKTDFLIDGTVDQCLKRRVSPMAYSTMAGGQFFADPGTETVIRIKKVADVLTEKYQTTYESLLTAWLLQHPAKILPIMGSTNPERMRTAIGALAIQMEREDWFLLWEAARGVEVA